MDENEYRDVYDSVNNRRCCFEKAVLTRRFGCSRMVKINIADREAVGCGCDEALIQCRALKDQLRLKAAFALKVSGGNGPLPHAKEIKAQCGGLMGLYLTLHPEQENISGVEDIYGTIEQALKEYIKLEQLPYDVIIKTISHFKGRPKRGQR